MIENKDTALKIAELLLKVKAIKLQPTKPFNWSSGWKSPIYCDNRVTLSHPGIRTHIRQAFCENIILKFGKPDTIAGVATGGVPQGVLVAQELGLPFIYVRSSAKEHGMGNTIEGSFEKGQRVILIEDLISTGGSSIKAVNALREGGLNVKGLASIFTYGFKIAEDNFLKADCPILALTDYTVLIEQALNSNYISQNDLKQLQSWRENPAIWMQEEK